MRTTLDSEMQPVLDKALRDGLMVYDRRHGWRGPLGKLSSVDNWKAELVKFAETRPPLGQPSWLLAVVLKVENDRVAIGLLDGKDGKEGSIPFAEMTWARPTLEEQKIGNPPRRPADVVAVGDVITVEPVTVDAKKQNYPAGTFGLRQIPDVEGALVAIDPHTGRVLAMAGGWSFEAQRVQPRHAGASASPAPPSSRSSTRRRWRRGFTPATSSSTRRSCSIQGPGQPLWKPENYGGDLLGPVAAALGPRAVAQPDDGAPRPEHRHGQRSRRTPRRFGDRRASASAVHRARRRRNHGAAS